MAVATEIALRDTRNDHLRPLMIAQPRGQRALLNELYHDFRSFKMLATLSSKQDLTLELRNIAVGLMLSYDPKEHRKELENLLGADEQSRKILIASWEFADQLPAVDRPKYFGFQRRYYSAFAVTPYFYQKLSSKDFYYGVDHFLWKDDDDQFLLRQADGPDRFIAAETMSDGLAIFLKPEYRLKYEEIKAKQKLEDNDERNRKLKK